MRSAAGGLLNQAQDLICGQRNDTEHEMAHHLGVAAHTDRAPAELVFQTRIHPLPGGAFAIAHILGVAEVQQLAPLLFGL
jgi:hypothetical protein